MSSETNNAPVKRRRAPRWLWIGFLVSVAINLLVVGFAVGALWHHKAGKAYRDRGAPRHFGAFLWRLPKERREMFKRKFRERRPEFKGFREDIRVARQEAEELLSKQPFDKASFAEANRKLHEARARLRGAQFGMFPEIAELMTAEERALFLEWRRKHRKRWRRWHRRDRNEAN